MAVFDFTGSATAVRRAPGAAAPFEPTQQDAWWEQPQHDPLPAGYLEFLEEARRLYEADQTIVFEKRAHKATRYTNRSYAGCDITASVTLPHQPSYTFGDISNISVSSHSESFPVRLLGRRAAYGYTQGPRTIGGSLVFALLDMYPFYTAASKTIGASGQNPWETGGMFPLADALPPFDITITLANEYEGAGAALRIYGVRIIDDGIVLSIDDLVTEQTFSYMALGIEPVHRTRAWKVVG